MIVRSEIPFFNGWHATAFRQSAVMLLNNNNNNNDFIFSAQKQPQRSSLWCTCSILETRWYITITQKQINKQNVISKLQGYSTDGGTMKWMYRNRGA